MDYGYEDAGGQRPLVVRVPVEPVEAVAEADAADAVRRAGNFAVRGPVFGVAAQDADDGARWRVVVAVTADNPQEARDSLNSLLWFKAKDDAKDRAERRGLLAAVAQLERERVQELTVLGTRYRVVRAEEYAGEGSGGIELPRPSDPEPAAPDWDAKTPAARIDDGLVLDPDAPLTPTQAAETVALRDLTYTGTRFPTSVRDDSRRARQTHPDVLLLPTTYTLVERSSTGWTPASSPHPTPHEARKTLEYTLLQYEPRRRGLLPDLLSDARTVLAAGDCDPQTAAQLATYVAGADRLRAAPVNELEVHGVVYRIARTRRMLRWGPDGPETPRPTDSTGQDPCPIHVPLDEDGNIMPTPSEEPDTDNT
ncbi:DUF5954 family protein [Streptomyces melanogenes]|uniref:DUF5954 family protein n=1 Tax=Streptomyces melanogenes TaxID=67326 RepID=A0ABZ1XWB3_9ACTN|nr:DUF5954 family protein [Streptomyces melanogenes]